MATLLQKRAAEEVVERGRKHKTLGKAVVEAVSSENTASAPTKVTESKGFKEEMAKYGLTEELITSSLVDDIKAKPRKRTEELKLGADILRMKQAPIHNNLNVIAIYAGVSRSKENASIPRHNGNKEDLQLKEENKSS